MSEAESPSPRQLADAASLLTDILSFDEGVFRASAASTGASQSEVDKSVRGILAAQAAISSNWDEFVEQMNLAPSERA